MVSRCQLDKIDSLLIYAMKPPTQDIVEEIDSGRQIFISKVDNSVLFGSFTVYIALANYIYAAVLTSYI